MVPSVDEGFADSRETTEHEPQEWSRCRMLSYHSKSVPKGIMENLFSKDHKHWTWRPA